MIIECNSCKKQFVVPDEAITATGRLVQCSSCGNKWTQFPITQEKAKTVIQPQIETTEKVIKKISKKKKSINKRKRPNQYTAEYLKKKHGIKIIDPSSENIVLGSKNKDKKVSFGFYNYLITYIVILIFLFAVLNYTKETLIINFPFLENKIYYFYETIENIKTILKNLLSF